MFMMNLFLFMNFTKFPCPFAQGKKCAKKTSRQKIPLTALCEESWRHQTSPSGERGSVRADQSPFAKSELRQ